MSKYTHKNHKSKFHTFLFIIIITIDIIQNYVLNKIKDAQHVSWFLYKNDINMENDSRHVQRN